MNAASKNVFFANPTHVPVGAPKGVVRIDLTAPKYGGRSISWYDIPSENSVVKQSFWIEYKEIDEAQYVSESVSSQILGKLPGPVGFEELAWRDGTYIDRNGKEVEMRGGAGGYPGNLFLKLFVATREGRYYAVDEIGFWDRDTWQPLEAGAIISGIDALINFEQDRAEGSIAPSKHSW
jgi:hypothetical protein